MDGRGESELTKLAPARALPPCTDPSPTAARVAPREEDIPAPGAEMGRYRVQRLIGQGGFGVVLAATDLELQRPVAIKLLKRRWNTTTGVQRLVAEARALAQLSHPNVVAVFEVGRHDGAQFIVMELVAGRTLSKVARRGHAASSSHRLALLVAAGRGLAAAHEVGVVHRDFKPDNVIVGDDGRVRVVDFGIAQQSGAPVGTDPDRDRASAPLSPGSLTETGFVIGTPMYLAPELVGGGLASAASDQYAFCVTAYRLLTGVFPFRGKTMQALAYAANHGEFADPRAERGHDRGVLAAIKRGLAADPGERWPSMGALLQTLEQRGRGRASWPGRALLGVGALALVLPWLPSEATPDTCDARAERVRTVWDEARAQAIGEALGGEAGWTRDAWTRTHEALDDYAARWSDVAREVCRTQREGLLEGDTGFARETALGRARRACLDDRLQRLGALTQWLSEGGPEVAGQAVQSARALPDLRACVDSGNGRRGPPTPEDDALAAEVAQVRAVVSALAVRLDSAQLDDDLPTRADAQVERARVLGYAPLVAETLRLQAHVTMMVGSLPEARMRFEEAYAAAVAATHDRVALECASMIVRAEGINGSFDEGQRWLRRAQALADRTDAGPRTRATLLQRAGRLHSLHGDIPEAIALGRRAVALVEDADATHRGPVLQALAATLDLAGEYAEAQDVAQRALAAYEAALGPQHPEVASAVNDVGMILWHRGDLDGAASRMRTAIRIQTEAMGPEHTALAGHLMNLGSVLVDSARYDEGREAYTQALTLARARHGEQSPTVAGLYFNLGRLEQHSGRYADARDHFEHARPIAEATLGPDHPKTALLYNNLGNLEHELGHVDKAIEWHERTLAIRLAALGEDHPHTAGSLENLARAELEVGAMQEAEAHARRSIAALESSLGPEHAQLAYSLTTLGEALLADARPDEAVPVLRRALSIRKVSEAETMLHHSTAFVLGEALVDSGLDAREGRQLMRAAQAFCRDDDRCDYVVERARARQP